MEIIFMVYACLSIGISFNILLCVFVLLSLLELWGFAYLQRTSSYRSRIHKNPLQLRSGTVAVVPSAQTLGWDSSYVCEVLKPESESSRTVICGHFTSSFCPLCPPFSAVDDIYLVRGPQSDPQIESVERKLLSRHQLQFYYRCHGFCLTLMGHHIIPRLSWGRVVVIV